MRNILSQSEIIDITGLRKPSKQLEWLQNNGFVEAKLNAKNQVVLSTLYFHQRSGTKVDVLRSNKDETILNLDALNDLMGAE